MHFDVEKNIFSVSLEEIAYAQLGLEGMGRTFESDGIESASGTDEPTTWRIEITNMALARMIVSGNIALVRNLSGFVFQGELIEDTIQKASETVDSGLLALEDARDARHGQLRTPLID